jgi:periplasmic divalent cation tolerance protein
MSGEIIVLITSPPNQSEGLARTLVEEHLAACVNIVPGVQSIYLWEGKVCNDSEQLLVVKSNRSAWEKLRERVIQLHSYEVPEIICLCVDDGDKRYIEWLNNALVSSKG